MWGAGWSPWQEGGRSEATPTPPGQSGGQRVGGSLWRGLPLTPTHRSRPQFDPELVLVSAGFDSAIGDPEVRAWPGWEGFRGPVARPVTPALVAGADAGHARVLRPPHAAAAGASWWPGLRHAGGDCGKQRGPTGQRLRCSQRGLLPNDTPAPVMPLSSSLLPLSRAATTWSRSPCRCV